MLAEQENFAGLAGINRELIGKVETLDAAPRGGRRKVALGGVKAALQAPIPVPA
jgi:hypothetical protein